MLRLLSHSSPLYDPALSRRKPSPSEILSRPLPLVTFRCRSCQRDGIGLALCGTRKMRRTPLRTPSELPTPARARQYVAARECPAATSLIDGDVDDDGMFTELDGG